METVLNVGGLFLIFAVTLPPSLVAAFLVWKFILRSERLGPGSGALIFATSALSACPVYGHFGPMPAILILLFLEPEFRPVAAIWMAATGVVVTGLFAWRSRREKGTLV